MKQFRKTLMAGAVASVLLASTAGVAGGDTWTYVGIGLNVASLALTILLPPPWVVLGVNVDAAQLIAEYMVYSAMQETTFTWEPEPAEEYEQAAQSNGGSGGGCGSGGVSYSSAVQKLPFQVASLQNVGIEAVGVGTELTEIVSTDTRSKILEQLGWLKEKDSKASSGTSGTTTEENTGAGSCSASYSVCLRQMTTEEENAVSSLQTVNEQNYGTAGIAHAELGLKSVQQAIANDGGSSVGKAGSSSSSENVTLAAGTTTTVQDLSKLIGTGANTVAAMKIVSLMNLELAQRLNQGNMMQGSVLTIEAARAFSNTSGITD